MHAGVLMVDHCGAALLVRQQDLVVAVVPAHLTDDVVGGCGDVAAEQQRATDLCGESWFSRDCS